jgi:hypothetical protein
MSWFKWEYAEAELTYFVNFYSQYQYHYFEFYVVHDLGGSLYEFANTTVLHEAFNLETVEETLKSFTPECYRLDPEFTIFYRIDEADCRLGADEILVEDYTFDLLNKAFLTTKEKMGERLNQSPI